MRSRILVGLLVLGLLVGLGVAGTVADSQPIVGRIELAAPWSLFLNGQYAYVFKQVSPDSPDGALYVVDISRPESPTLVGQTRTDGTARAGEFQGNYLYVIEDRGLNIYDISDPSAPRRVGHLVVEGPLRDSLKVIDSYLYVSRDEDLQVFDVSDPTLPSLVAILPGVYGVVLHADPPHLYAVGSYLWDVNISDPTHPVVQGRMSIGGWPIWSVYYPAAKYLYVYATHGNQLEQLTAIDATNLQASSSQELADYGYPSLEGGLLYLVVTRAVQVYRLTNPAYPKLGVVVQSPLPGFRATVRNGVEYSLDNGGLNVYSLPHIFPFKSYLSALEVLKGAAD